MLVVRGRKAAGPPPDIHGVQGLVTPDQEVVEGHREGARVGTPKGPLGQAAVGSQRRFWPFEDDQGRVHWHQKDASGGGPR